jgi:hypothetical protein
MRTVFNGVSIKHFIALKPKGIWPPLPSTKLNGAFIAPNNIFPFLCPVFVLKGLSKSLRTMLAREPEFSSLVICFDFFFSQASLDCKQRDTRGNAVIELF